MKPFHCSVICLGIVTACVPKRSTEEAAPPQASLSGVKMWQYELDTLSAVGRAARLTYQRASSDFEASEVLLRFPPRDQRNSSTPGGLELRTPVMTGNRSLKQATGKEEVVIRTATGLVGYTTSAFFDGVAMTITGDDVVQMRGPTYNVSGVGFVFYLRDEIYNFYPTVKTHVGGTP